MCHLVQVLVLVHFAYSLMYSSTMYSRPRVHICTLALDSDYVTTHAHPGTKKVTLWYRIDSAAVHNTQTIIVPGTVLPIRVLSVLRVHIAYVVRLYTKQETSRFIATLRTQLIGEAGWSLSRSW